MLLRAQKYYSEVEYLVLITESSMKESREICADILNTTLSESIMCYIDTI